MLWLLGLIVVLVSLVLLRELLIFLVILQFFILARHARSKGQRTYQRKFLEACLKDRSLLFSGEWFKSEHRWQEALSQAEQQGNQEKIADCRWYLAAVQMKRGRLAEAYAEAQQALEVNGKVQRQVLMTQAEVLRAWGRFDEAVIVRLPRKPIKALSLSGLIPIRRALHAADWRNRHK